MHGANSIFWRYVSQKFSEYFTEDILEFGSYNINGSIREHFKNHKKYIGIDWRAGLDVDVVALAQDFKYKTKAKAVLSASMLEHDPYWEKSLANMIDNLSPNGILVLSWGSAKCSEHCLAEAPDGQYHALKAEKVINFLKSRHFIIHTGVYDGNLLDVISDVNDINTLSGPSNRSQYVNGLDGFGEYNLVAFPRTYTGSVNDGYITPLQDEDKIKTCYVPTFYFGERRHDVERFKVDRLCYLKAHIECLEKYKHSLSKIIFNFNVEKDHYKYLTEAMNLIPKKIQNADVEINIRENFGMSYAGFSEVFSKHLTEFDYYIFNEDDYYFIQDNFDQYLLNKFNSLPNCGYVCGLVREFGFKSAGVSTGISSSSILKKVFDTNNNELPHSKNKDYIDNEKNGQINQTNYIVNLGYEIYDIREDYQMRFWDYDKLIHNYFLWNTKELLVPANIFFNEPYGWVDEIDEQYLKMSSNRNSSLIYNYHNETPHRL